MNYAGAQLDTKERILDAAERLFGEHGIAAASLREITSAARVNLAAVNYHFRSKNALAEAVLARRVAPVNRCRLELLEQYAKDAGDGPLDLERIMATFLAPALDLRRQLGPDGENFMKFMGRVHAEPGEHIREMLRNQFAGVVAPYMSALRRALPEISEADLAYGMHFTIGVMAHTMIGGGFLQLYGGVADPSDTEGLVRRFAAYTAAGFRALAAGGPNTGRSRNGKK